MRALILGASGLIGHMLFRKLSDRFDQCYGTLHRSRSDFANIELFNTDRIIDRVDVADWDNLQGILQAVSPDVVLNCVGITKRKPAVNDPLQAIGVNSLFPHKLAAWGSKTQTRVVHFSTDCVFDGSIGDYDEESDTTGKDAYGKTKALGEIRYPHSLTIRSSFIGREIDGKSELLEWFLAQQGKEIRGFTNALYSGVSTIEMCRVVGDIIESHPELGGLYTLAMPQPISKYDLLCLAREAFQLDVEIVADDEFEIKPTLNGNKLREAIGVQLPQWPDMMKKLAADPFYRT